jgi:hypothetical protein
VGRAVGAVAVQHRLAILGILGIAFSLPLAVGTHGGAPNQPARAKGGRYRAAARASRPRERARRLPRPKPAYPFRFGHGDGGIPGRAPATAAANGGLAHTIHDLVLGY